MFLFISIQKMQNIRIYLIEILTRHALVCHRAVPTYRTQPFNSISINSSQRSYLEYPMRPRDTYLTVYPRDSNASSIDVHLFANGITVGKRAYTLLILSCP